MTEWVKDRGGVPRKFPQSSKMITVSIERLKIKTEQYSHNHTTANTKQNSTLKYQESLFSVFYSILALAPPPPPPKKKPDTW